ncbi:MAG: hypothetical protein AB1405_02960 [Bdellovibrionota bacterium]
MGTHAKRPLQLIRSGPETKPATGGKLGEQAISALERERAYEVARQRNRRQATRRAGDLLRERVGEIRVDVNSA